MADLLAISSKLKRQAEEQMGRRLPGDGDFDQNHPVLGRYDYDAVSKMTDGTCRGFLATCGIRRERSCAREANLLLNYDDQLSVAKVSARGIVVLVKTDNSDDKGKDETDKDIELLSRTNQLYQGNAEDVQFMNRIMPVLRTTSLDDLAPTMLQRVGEDLAKACCGCPSVFGALRTKKILSIAIAFNGRKLVEESVKLDCIATVASSFSKAIPSGCQVTVDLKHPDILIVMEALAVMTRNFLLVGVAPAAWLTRGRLRALPTRALPNKRQKTRQ